MGNVQPVEEKSQGGSYISLYFQAQAPMERGVAFKLKKNGFMVMVAKFYNIGCASMALEMLKR